MMTTQQIIKAGEEFDVFTPVNRKHEGRFGEGFSQTKQQTLCYKGLDCVFWEEEQFLLLVGLDGGVCYAGYCDQLGFFLELCRHISPGGVFNDYPLQSHAEEFR